MPHRRTDGSDYALGTDVSDDPWSATRRVRAREPPFAGPAKPVSAAARAETGGTAAGAEVDPGSRSAEAQA